MTDAANGSKTGLEPIAKRVPIQRQIELRFSNFEGLVTGVSANLSTSGMFIQTNTPEVPGTDFSFNLRIEEWSPIRGNARVVWTRARTEGPERPAGMGVEFLELDAQSRRMIRWLVDKYLQGGGKPFDLGKVPAGASKVGSGTTRKVETVGGRRAGATARSSKAPPRMRRPRSHRVAVVLFLLALAGLAAYRLWTDRQADRGRPQQPASVIEQADADARAEIREGDPDQTASSDSQPVQPASAEAVSSFVRTWASAWESRDAEALTALYSADFGGSAYGGRASWQAEVERRMNNSDHLRVAISALEVDFPDAETATATFYRSIRSAAGDETRRMMLELEPTADSWLIRGERYLD